jgi:xanthine/uracil permease
VILVTLGLKFFARGMLSVSAVLIGLLAGYAVAYLMGMVSFAGTWASGPPPSPSRTPSISGSSSRSPRSSASA